MCVWGGGGGGTGGAAGTGTGKVIAVYGGVGGMEWGKETGKVIHLFQNALKNLANKYFLFGQFLMLYCPLWCSGIPTNGLRFESH